MVKIKENGLFLAFLALIAALSLSGSLFYWFYKLDTLGIVLSFTLGLFIAFWTFKKSFRKDMEEEEKTLFFRHPLKTLTLFLFLLFSALAFWKLKNSISGAAISSPWQVLGPSFFFYYLGAFLSLFFYLQKEKDYPNKKPVASLLLVSLFFFLSFSLSAIVYKIGFGYDPFIHQATVELIAQDGSVEPKTFYYIGQYALETILHQALTLDVVLIDKFLVPFLAAFFLPFAFRAFFRKNFPGHNENLMTLIPLIFTFSFFTFTTPQNLAYLFLLLSVLLMRSYYSLGWLLAIAALLIHPLAGLPAVIFALFLTFWRFKEKINSVIAFFLQSLLFLGSALTIPLALYLSGRHYGLKALNWQAWGDFWQNIGFKNQADIFLNFSYTYLSALKLIFVLLVLLGLYLAIKKRSLKGFRANVLSALALLLSFFLSQGLNYEVINYEQADFPLRILNSLSLILLPLALWPLASVFKKAGEAKNLPRLAAIIFFSFLIGASLYGSYPRVDKYHRDRGFAVSQADYEAVSWIKEKAEGDYLILANQQTCVMALRELGFKNNYYNDMFLCPIPTSGELYKHYLAMVYEEASYQNIEKAMDLMQRDEAYFVLNKYWWAFPKILEEAKTSSLEYASLSDGEIYVFKYKRR